MTTIACTRAIMREHGMKGAVRTTIKLPGNFSAFCDFVDQNLVLLKALIRNR
jgi:hypothetical protein